jgi:hypothetical protein
MIWNAAIYCTRVEPDTDMVSLDAPWFSSTQFGSWDTQAATPVESAQRVGEAVPDRMRDS